MSPSRPRLGAYVLPGDPVWLRSSLSRYYGLLDRLVVPVPEDGLSWRGASLPVQECLEIIKAVDHRGIVEVIHGTWTDTDHPLRAENAQRQAAIDELGDVDWVLQVDNDEFLPDVEALLGMLRRAEHLNLSAVEWPMRVVFRRLRSGRYLEVVDANRQPRYDYPGPIAVRPGVRVVDCRRVSEPFLRPVVRGDTSSTQVARPVADGELRMPGLEPGQAILHNSWGRPVRDIRRKMGSSSHQLGPRMIFYFWAVWRASPLTWRWLRNFHLLQGPLWPRLAVLNDQLTQDLEPQDRV